MCIALYGTLNECDACKSFLPQYEVKGYNTIEQIIPALSEETFDAVFVIMDNADGMECVISAKSQNSSIPVVWLSNDKDFAPQAFRLGVEFFGLKPVTAEKIKKAFKKCKI